MESIYLKNFLKQIGNSVHSINTAVVGLDGVENGVCTKSASLTISWTPRNQKISARSARKFIINASLIFIAETIKQYMLAVIKKPLLKNNFQDIPTDKHLSEKFELFSQKFKFDIDYWIPSVLLLLHWRNITVHTNSKAKLTSTQIDILKQNKLIIEENHSGTNILNTVRTL